MAGDAYDIEEYVDDPPRVACFLSVAIGYLHSSSSLPYRATV